MTTPSSLSVVESSHSRTGGGAAGSDEFNHESTWQVSASSSPSFDFIGSSSAVKDLFSLPYVVDRPISVAIHNLEGTLLVDGDPDQDDAESNNFHESTGANARPGSRRSVMKPAKSLQQNEEESSTQTKKIMSRSLVALSNSESTSEALTIVNSLIDSDRPKSRNPTFQLGVATQPQSDEIGPGQSTEQCEASLSTLGIPRPEDYVSDFIPPVSEPREYLSWKFHDMNLLFGSNAIIYRSPDASTAMTVRLEEADKLKALAQRHEDMVKSGEFRADHQYPELKQAGKPSYAEATGRDLQQIEHESGIRSNDKDETGASFAAPDLKQVRLQTCIVPAPNGPVGGMLAARSDRGVVRLEATTPTSEIRQSSSPISVVLDTYLDNIMANVPQLALCLQEKGFVQSVKLLNTETIPSSLLQPSTFDTSIPFEVVAEGNSSEQVFSPHIMEMNAATLLRFLKTQCTRDNATYLLRREAGRTNIQIYDISSISSPRQQKWNWWLAMMSYRFANRLRSLASSTPDKALRRCFRARQRSLLQNAVELLDKLSDMNGNAHASLIAAINENIADTYLTNDKEEVSSGVAEDASKQPAPATLLSSTQHYGNISVDSLTKAQDYFVNAIRVLWPTLERITGRSKRAARRRERNPQVVVVSLDSEDVSSDESDDDENDKSRGEIHDHANVIPVATQLFGLHYKLVSVSLRLAEIHLGNYYSSSAMQALRTAARRLSDSIYLAQLVSTNGGDSTQRWTRQLRLRYTWLWEHCGHFARSFAADELWRDRGHASGEDVISVLRDVESALRGQQDNIGLGTIPSSFLSSVHDALSEKTEELINTHSLRGLVSFHSHDEKKKEGRSFFSNVTMEAAAKILDGQRLLKREQRRVLVAACISYGRSIDSYCQVLGCGEEEDDADHETLLGILHQRLGDACNETGKIMMSEVHNLLAARSAEPTESQGMTDAADPLLRSAEFWFLQGLAAFEACKDLRNLALLRCNLCQCWKLRANSVFVEEDFKSLDGASHAETCLQEAANQLQAAHESLEQRDRDSLTWDMVSGELAATFLVLGVRRRQSLIGCGDIPVTLQTLRLSPGKERSVVDPMERALDIYQQSGNHHQAAAAHYQLALFYSKIWTCQRDESKTREKLAAAFQHYSAAHAFFSQAVQGNESTFCLLCLDLSNLYASVSGEECLAKALARCLDTASAFSRESIDAATAHDLSKRNEWLQKMATIATSVEERVFKILRALAKIDEPSGKKDYKELYRVGLQAKIASEALAPDELADPIAKRLLGLNGILVALQQQFEDSD